MDTFEGIITLGNPNTAQLLIVRGLPGSGKSTYAKSLIDRVHFEADMYFSRNGEYKWVASELGHAHKWCQEQVRKSLSEGNKVVVSNTFTKKWEMKDYLEMTPSVAVVEMTSQYKNIHGVSEEHILKMRERYEKL